MTQSMFSSAVPAGCWDLDLATGNLALCPQSRRMFGLSEESSRCLTESEWTSRFHPEDLAPVREALSDCLSNRTPYAQRFRTLHADGRTQWVLGIGRPVESAGEPARFVGWNFDVVTTGDMAANWIAAHPGILDSEQQFAVTSAIPRQASPPCSGAENVLRARAESILRVRQARERLLGRAVMGEPAFDLLLCLYIRSEHKETSLASLARPARIPYSSALRWIHYLSDKGLVECTESKVDRRVTSVELTASGRAILDELFRLS